MKKRDKKQILALNYEFPPLGGGAANATLHMLKEFSNDSDLEIDLVTSSIDKFRREKFADNIKIHYLDIGKGGNMHYQSNKDLLKYSWKAYWYCRRLMHKNRYKICHAFFGIPCGFIAMMLGIPYIVSLRGSDVPFYNKRFEKLDKLIFKRLSQKIWHNAVSVYTNSAGLKDLALKSSPKQKISVIYNGVDTKKFHPALKKKKNKALTIISTGRLIERKGYQFLIPALKCLDVKLQLVGDGNFMDELKELSKKYKIVVDFLGNKNHNKMIPLLQKADVFVLPSLNEGMSNSILEAMACGLPIIATNVGGSNELVKGNGMIVKKEVVSVLREAVKNYVSDKNLALMQGKISRKLTEKMNWKVMAESYKKEYLR